MEDKDPQDSKQTNENQLLYQAQGRGLSTSQVETSPTNKAFMCMIVSVVGTSPVGNPKPPEVFQGDQGPTNSQVTLSPLQEAPPGPAKLGFPEHCCQLESQATILRSQRAPQSTTREESKQHCRMLLVGEWRGKLGAIWARATADKRGLLLVSAATTVKG